MGVVVASTIRADVPATPCARTSSPWARLAGVTVSGPHAASASAGSPPTDTATDALPSARNATGAAMATPRTRTGIRAGPTMSSTDATATASVPGHEGAARALSTSPTERTTFSSTRTPRHGPVHAASSSEVR